MFIIYLLNIIYDILIYSLYLKGYKNMLINVKIYLYMIILSLILITTSFSRNLNFMSL